MTLIYKLRLPGSYWVTCPLLNQSLWVRFKPHALRINKCGFLWRFVGLLPEAQIEGARKVKPVGSPSSLNIQWIDKGTLNTQGSL